jgi:hypothetical protein
MFESLCEASAIQSDLVDGVKRLKNDSHEGKTLAIRHLQARALLVVPDPTTLAYAIARYWPPSFITVCAAQNYARCVSWIYSIAVVSSTYR